ncbi:hypothetical protein CESP606_21790 [Cereibacter sphaeroides]
MAEQRNRPVARIRNGTHPLAQVERARDLRNVRCRVVQAQVRLEILPAPLGDNLAMSVSAEAIGHHPVIAQHQLQPVNRELAEFHLRHGAGEGLDNRLPGSRREPAILIAHRLDVEAHVVARLERMEMQQLSVASAEGPDCFRRLGAATTRLAQQDLVDAPDHLSDGRPQNRGRGQAEDLAQVDAGMGDAAAVGPRGHQRSVRLDRAGRGDRFHLADRRVEGAPRDRHEAPPHNEVLANVRQRPAWRRRAVIPAGLPQKG